jgi:hypothetical protein
MSLLRTGYDLPLWLPVTGLVYVVVSDAPRHVAVSGVQHAKVAPIMRASRIVISDDTNNRKRTIRLAYNVSAILHDKVASHSHKGGGFLRVLWNSRGQNDLTSSGNLVFIERIEKWINKFLGRLLCCFYSRNKQNLTGRFLFNSRGFAVVDKIDVGSDLVPSFNGKRNHPGRPDIRSLISNELNPTIIASMVGTHRYPPSQSALPEGDPGIDKHGQQREALQPHSCGFTSPIFLALGFVCGFVLFALGAVSLLYLWRTVNLNGTANRNLVFGLSLPISAALISLGQWILFSVT